MTGTTKDQNGTAGLNIRLTRLEESFGELQKEQSLMSNVVAGMSQKLDSALQNNSTPKVTMSSLFQVLGLLGTWSALLGAIILSSIDGKVNPILVELNYIKERINTHQADGHPHTVIGQIGQVKEQFAEVETQNRALKETMLLRDKVTKYEAILERHNSKEHDHGTDNADIPQWRQRGGKHPEMPIPNGQE